jgi:hypothetical protein
MERPGSQGEGSPAFRDWKTEDGTFPVSFAMERPVRLGICPFAVQVKHIASANYFLWSPHTGDPAPASIKDGNGPAEAKIEAEILKFLRDSFALGHKAAATLAPQNSLEPPAGSNPPTGIWPKSV